MADVSDLSLTIRSFWTWTRIAPEHTTRGESAALLLKLIWYRSPSQRASPSCSPHSVGHHPPSTLTHTHRTHHTPHTTHLAPHITHFSPLTTHTIHHTHTTHNTSHHLKDDSNFNWDLQVLRDECIYTLGMIARLGALPLLQPAGIFVNLIAGVLSFVKLATMLNTHTRTPRSHMDSHLYICSCTLHLRSCGIFVRSCFLAGALLAPETRTKAYAAFFWQASPLE